jgi:L-lactate dehydrogenase (cytochrome)
MANRIITPVSPADYRELARRRLPAFLFHYIDGGANDEDSMAANIGGFRRIRLRQRVLRDVSAVDTRTELAGQAAAMPLALAPVGLAGMMARRGEVQAARAAAAAGVPFTLSTVGICPLEEVRAASPQDFWFQLYMLRDRGLVSRLLERAWAVGCRTLVFTVDLAVTGVRHRDLRYGMLGTTARARLARAWQLMTHPRWVLDVAVRGKPHDFGNLRDIMPLSSDLDAYKAFIGAQFDPTVTWRDIGWLRSQWQGKILIKGVMNGEDALEAADAGADGVVVSNHGGRQLDGVPATIDQLPGVVAAASGRLEVYLDGGVRNGLDVVRAVALGARGVLIGRPWIFAVAACGEAGLRDLLAVMHREISVAMALMGVNRISELNPDCVEIR